MKRIEADSKLLRLAADFVERSQPVVNVKHGVLVSFGHDRPRGLLKLEDKMRVRGACVVIEIFRKPEEQNIAQKIKDRFFNCGIPALGCRDGALDYLSILVVHRPSRRKVGSINRKAGNRLADGARERFEREIAIPAVLLGKPIDHVAQNINVVGERQSHHEQLLRVREMPEMQRVTEETMERLCDLRFG